MKAAHPRGNVVDFVPMREALDRVIGGSPGAGCLGHLSDAAERLTKVTGAGRVRCRGRYVRDFYSDEEASLADTVEIPPDTLNDFTRFDLDRGGLRRSPNGVRVVDSSKAPDQSFDRAFDVWAADDTSEQGARGARLADGYRHVEFALGDLKREFAQKAARGPGRPRELDRDKIIARSRELRAERADISISSAALSISEEMANPRTGRKPDTRGIERIIAPAWRHPDK